MSLANPAARFQGNPAPVDPNAPKPYERRSVCVLPRSQVNQLGERVVMTRCRGGCHTHLTRSVVKLAVERGEMQWVDAHRNAAAYTVPASATWQKTVSGPVHTMQMVAGRKGRYVPLGQREACLG